MLRLNSTLQKATNAVDNDHRLALDEKLRSNLQTVSELVWNLSATFLGRASHFTCTFGGGGRNRAAKETLNKTMFSFFPDF